MKQIFINGVGIMSPAAKSVAELAELLSGKKEAIQAERADFPLGVSPGKVRRCPRQVKLAVSAASQLLANKDWDKERTGTLLSTGFGPVETICAFSNPVVDGELSLCSPALFSFTVHNSCLGQLCIVYGLKGPSTMLIGGDPLEYSSLLLTENKADNIICGAVEEYTEDLVSSVRTSGLLDDTFVSEAAAMLVLSGEASFDSYAGISGFASELFPAQPYIHQVTDEVTDIMERVIAEAVKAGKPDLVFTLQNGSYFDRLEQKAISKVLPAVKEFAIKKLLGETLGASYLSSVAAAAVTLREQLDIAGVIPQRILVTGVDMQGNYLAVVLEKAQ